MKKVKEAIALDLPASAADLSWETFVLHNKFLADCVATDHQGPASDRYKLARNNFNNQAKRLLGWIDTGKGK